MVGEKQDTLKSYDLLGGRIYDIRYAEEQIAKYETILEKVDLEDHEILLDDGCGTGLLLRSLSSVTVGIDSSFQLLSAAHLKTKGMYNIHLIQADADQLPTRSRVFHKISSVTLIQNIPDPLQTILEMKRVGRAGSTLIITALKKAFNLSTFEQTLEASGLSLEYMIRSSNIKDWIAITKKLDPSG
jgi:ubiquinone/menaquinone biosynthesis C-methylase UbiE